MREGTAVTVTGAFGFSGKYIARRFLDAGCRVRTLTRSPDRPNPFGEAVEVHPFDFDRPDRLVETLRGSEVLVNTYWIRFNRRGVFSFAEAVDNSLALFRAAKAAEVRRVVHVSIVNPSEDSPLEYFRAKARLERALVESGLSHAILRPAVLFGKEDILINNIAWTVRRFLVIPLFGDGRYRLQPIHVDDLALLAVEQAEATENRAVDAVGPETYTYRELVEMIAETLGKRRYLVGVPPRLGYLGTLLLGKMVGDVIVTPEEIEGLMAGLLAVESPPTGRTRLSEYVRANASTLGLRYASEMARRANRAEAYERL